MLTKLAAWLISWASVKSKDMIEYKDMVSIGKGRTSDCDTQEQEGKGLGRGQQKVNSKR